MSGRHVTLDFAASSFSNVFHAHLDWIIAWSTRQPGPWSQIAEKLGNAAVYIVHAFTLISNVQLAILRQSQTTENPTQ